MSEANLTVRIERTDDLPLEFTGTLLTDQTTQHDEPASERSTVQWDGTSRNRWSELRIYSTESGKWVIEFLGCTQMPGEETFRNVVVVDEPEAVAKTVLRLVKKKPLPLYVADALQEAGENDPRLIGKLVERI